MPGVFEKLRTFVSSSLSVPDYHSGLLSVTSNIKWTSFLPGPRNRAPNIAAFRHLGHERKGRENRSSLTLLSHGGSRPNL